MEISGNIVDLVENAIYPGIIEISEGVITRIKKESGKHYDTFITPGLVDSHVHIESSMMVPSEFARLAVRHGTVASISDPHEIANVLGVPGVDYMVQNGKLVPFKFYFGAPSSVPATPFESSGASIGTEDVKELLRRDDIKYLSEMMNFPGVLNNDPEVMAKIAAATKSGKPVDGHAPGLTGEALKKYFKAGITTDHETLAREEAQEKLALGMKLLIREGSAAKDFDTFIGFLDTYPEQCMFCSDDKHPDDLVAGHINVLVQRALASGLDRMKVLRCASLTPVQHYGLDAGLLQEGDAADFLEVDNLSDFNVLRTFIDGQLVAERGEARFPMVAAGIVNNFKQRSVGAAELVVRDEGNNLKVIEALDGQLYTGRSTESPKVMGGNVVSDLERDILKIAVINRYQEAPPAIGFIRGFGIKGGAIAASIAHDSHNVIAVGAGDEDICAAINAVMAQRGGICTVKGSQELVLPLPVAGLMSDLDGKEVAALYTRIDRSAKDLGSSLTAPFMTLSFMALPVIPRLKMTDRGLFDVDRFEPTSVFE